MKRVEFWLTFAVIFGPAVGLAVLIILAAFGYPQWGVAP